MLGHRHNIASCWHITIKAGGQMDVCYKRKIPKAVSIARPLFFLHQTLCREITGPLRSKKIIAQFCVIHVQ